MKKPNRSFAENGKKPHRHPVREFFKRFSKKVHANKVCFAVYTVMELITVAVIVLTALRGHFESTFTAVLTLILFLIPTFVEESFRIKLPTTLEILVVLFVFCANILGEIGEYYTKFPFWDNMLHYTSGFMFAAFGFSLADIFNRHRKVNFSLSPFFLSLVAVCFAVTVGVVWEFFEFGMDMLFRTDMQKDFVVSVISSAEMNPDGQAPKVIREITQTVITTANGEIYTVDGYLDIGLLDTMKDLIVDFAGALLFAVIGYFYTRHSNRGRIAKGFIPQVEVIIDPDADTEEPDRSEDPI